MMGNYQTFRELEKNEIEGIDYRIQMRYGSSGIAVMAPHGGAIESGTTEIADAVAGFEHTFYTFRGIKAQGNAGLHITSRKFDEPRGSQIAKNSWTVLTIHGCKESKKLVYIGGRDRCLKKYVRRSLLDADFIIREIKRYPGQNPDNLCNRSRLRMGVQLEITQGLRREIIPDLPNFQPAKKTVRFEQLITALQHALSRRIDDFAGSNSAHRQLRVKTRTCYKFT